MPKMVNPEESYNKFCNEYFTLFKQMDLSSKEKARRDYLFNKIEELQAVYFGNPKGLKICKACQRRIVKDYNYNGVFLTELCPYCYKNGDSEDFLKRNYSIGGKHSAIS